MYRITAEIVPPRRTISDTAHELSTDRPLWLQLGVKATVGGLLTSFPHEQDYIFSEQVKNNWIECISDAAVAQLWMATFGIYYHYDELENCVGEGK